MIRALAIAAAATMLSLLLVAPAPSYDPWSWLLWGREAAAGGLSTVDGPAFKPLPVALCALLAPFGAAAPWLWIALVRVAAAIAAVLAYRIARRLAGGSRVAGLLGAGAVLLCGALPAYSAAGAEPALVVALALGGAVAWRERRMRIVLACAIGCSLLRVEAWPFVVAVGLEMWRARPRDRVLLAALAVALPAAWLLPELIGSGDVLRSGARARVPNPGQPALADAPALASLRAAVTLPLWPLWLGVGALLALDVRAALGRDAGADGSDTSRWARGRRRGASGSDAPRWARGRRRGAGGSDAPRWALARTTGPAGSDRRHAALLPAAAGAAWIAIVALMAQAGFSGEPRYALPGAAMIALSGAIGLSVAASRVETHGRKLGKAALAVAVALLAVAAAPRLTDLPALRSEQAYQWRLAGDLRNAIRAAGGRSAVLACGRPYVGPLRGPLLAYRLNVAKRVVEPDAPPRPPGVVFRSSLHPAAASAPEADGFSEIARTGAWQVLAACRHTIVRVP